jgi:hypothetical protein
MENFIKSDDLNSEIIQKILEDAALQPTLDDDGDIYVSREVIDFGCWVRYIENNKLINLFTYAKVNEGINEHQMYEFVNKLNTSIMIPQFYALGSSKDGFNLYGSYFIPTLFGADKRFIVATLRRFSGAFLAGLKEDANDVFFE